MRYWIPSCLIITLLVIFFSKCTQDKALQPPPPKLCDTIGVSYDLEVDTIIKQNCASSSCHGQGSSQGGVSLENYQEVKDEAVNGDLLCAIKHQSGCSNMPFNQPQLPDSLIQIIDCWVKNDAPQN